MTNNQMRVAIAKDVLKKIEIKKYIVTQGLYFAGYTHIDTSKYKPTSQLQTILKKEIKTCHVCAKGALFASCIDKYNKLKLRDVNSYYFRGAGTIVHDNMIGTLKEYFPRGYLDDLECRFEGSNLPVAVLKNAMKKIIKNKGVIIDS